MSTITQHLLAALCVGAGLGLSSCNVAPEDVDVPVEFKAVVTADPTPEPTQTADTALVMAPAPVGETRRATPLVPTAVIHVRVPTKAAAQPTFWARLEPLYVRAQAASDRFRFGEAIGLYRELRDSPWTPKPMRRRFHAQVAKYTGLRHGIKKVRQALGRGDYQLADQRLRALVRANPEVPMSVLVDMPAMIKLVGN